MSAPSKSCQRLATGAMKESKGGGVAAQVDEHGVEPRGAAHRLQAVLRPLEAFAGVAVGAARSLESTGASRPGRRSKNGRGSGSCRASGRAFASASCRGGCHTLWKTRTSPSFPRSMMSGRPANSMGRASAHLRYAPAGADAGPGAGQEHVLLPLGEGVRDIGLVGEPARPLLDRAHHVCEGVC